MAYPCFSKPFEIYVNPQMETNSIRKRGFPAWEFLSLPAHYFCTGTPHMEMVILFLATSKSRVEEHIPPNFGQEIKIFPLSHFCDTLKELCVPNISSIARLPIIRSIALTLHHSHLGIALIPAHQCFHLGIISLPVRWSSFLTTYTLAPMGTHERRHSRPSARAPPPSSRADVIA